MNYIYTALTEAAKVKALQLGFNPEDIYQVTLDGIFFNDLTTIWF